MDYWDTLPSPINQQPPEATALQQRPAGVPRWLRIGCASCLIVTAILLISLHACTGPLTYTAEPIHGRVNDAESGESIEGVVVVAIWKLRCITDHPSECGVLHSHETVTDASGAFHIPAMPRKVRPFGSYLDFEDPVILRYKPGYWAGKLDNHASYVPVIITRGSRVGTKRLPDGRILEFGRTFSRESVRFSYWSGKELLLRKVATTKQAADSYDFMRRYIDRAGLPVTDVPILWQALIGGFEQLDPETQRKTDFGNPALEVESR